MALQELSMQLVPIKGNFSWMYLAEWFIQK